MLQATNLQVINGTITNITSSNVLSSNGNITNITTSNLLSTNVLSQTISSGTIWIAFIVHVVMAWTNTFTALKFNPEMQYQK